MNNLIRSLFLVLASVWTHCAFAQASITLSGPPSSSYMAPANFDLQATYYVSSGPKAEFIEDPVVSQNGAPIARLLEGTVPIRGLPAGRYEFIFTARAVRILPDGDMTSRPLRSGPIIVDVTAPPVPVDSASPGATSYPNPSLAGRAGAVTIQMINTGETTWSAGSYVLDTPHEFTRDFWKFSPQPVTHDVPPGASFTFNFAITPSYYDPHVEWRNIEFQLRRDHRWFGLKSYTSIFVREPMNAAAFDSQSVSAQMEAGKPYEVVIRMRNAGDDPWRSQEGFALGSQNPGDNMTWGIHRITTGDVPVGEVGEFRAVVTAPGKAGSYSFQWRMLREGVEWFGVPTPDVLISVVEPPPPPPPALVGTTYVYDALGREIGTSADSELGPLVTATAYLPGNRRAHANARGKVTTTTYQGFETPSGEHVLKVEEPEGRVTHIDRDRFAAIHRIAREVGSGSIERKYVYDAHHRLCKSLEPESGATVMGYDPAGRILWRATGLDLPSLKTCDSEVAQASSRTISHSYDVNGRLAAIYSPDGNGNQTFRYAPDGLVLEATAGNGGSLPDSAIKVGYNSRRMVTSETSSLSGRDDWTSSYYYDANGSVTKHALPSGVELNYAPDALGRPRHVIDQRGRVFASEIKRHANGAVSGFTYGNGIAHRIAQNLRQLPARISSGAAMDFEYYYDERANVAGMADHTQGPSATRLMTYDGIDRLISVQSELPGVGQRFEYDQADNLRRIDTIGQLTRHHYFDAHHRLTNVRDDAGSTITGLAYDSAGNVSRKNGVAYTFDLQNRLRSSGDGVRYGYDARGRRVQLADGSSTSDSRYMYLSSGDVSRAFDGESVVLTENVYLGRDAIASIRTSIDGTESINFHHIDALGSRVASTQADGALLRRTSYSAFGSSDQAASGAIGYTGHIEDAATDMIYMQQRYYDPSIGSFLSTDPVTLYGSGVIGQFSRYSYAYNNPYRFSDPDGRCPWCVGAGIGIGLELARQVVTGEIQDTSLRGIAGNVGKALIAGAAGATGSGISSGVARLTTSLAVRATANAAAGAAIGAVSTGANNAIEGGNLTDGMSTSALVGGATGAAGSLIGDAIDVTKAAINTRSVNAIPLADRNLLDHMKATTPKGSSSSSIVGGGAAASNAISNSNGIVESCAVEKGC
ncbi:RHS repeat-associated core domain-containing protein [Stenotrophomonas sp. S41]|uniref:RHS repeat domain-containing protein n=1 Tax=Stenotrophomonas sp. S41 TaxID=2767464 RepID=UPI00190CD88D|nr:RHS repeat-associated core domain-containing protein [Stenotrophomonas sp. S41]MBK0014069.1 hypothetical protein [Stenotrophomonas sp. S41]